jgi:hypothetical protein
MRRCRVKKTISEYNAEDDFNFDKNIIEQKLNTVRQQKFQEYIFSKIVCDKKGCNISW